MTISPGSESTTRFDRLPHDIGVKPLTLILAHRDSQHAVPLFGNGHSDPCGGCPGQARGNLQRLNAFVEQDYALKGEIDGRLIYGRKEEMN